MCLQQTHNSPWHRKWQPAPVFLPGESHRQRSLVGYSPWGLKESGMAEQLSTHVCMCALTHTHTDTHTHSSVQHDAIHRQVLSGPS